MPPHSPDDMGLAVAATATYADDRALVARCLAGERAAERELFRRERARVHATLFRVVGSTRELDDLIQESFLEVFRSLPRWRAEAKLSTWIDRIAVRVAYRHFALRRPATAALELVPEPASGDAGPERRAHAREGVRRLYEVLARLAPPARLAWTLHAVDGRSIAEVADLVGSTRIATKVRIWRAQREIERHAAADPLLRQFLQTADPDAPAREDRDAREDEETP